MSTKNTPIPSIFRSWNRNYDEDLAKIPRRFDFNAISPHDILYRTINETHKAFLPERNEYRVFRNPRNDGNDDEGEIVHVSDPRRPPAKSTLSSKELIACYQNPSSLTRIEQNTFYDDIKKSNDEQLQVQHNPQLLIDCRQKRQKLKLLPNLLEKRKLEMENFNKSAEIAYYQQLAGYSARLDKAASEFLCEIWNRNRCDNRYSIITKLMRELKTEDELNIDIQRIDSDEIPTFPLPKDNFPCINKLSTDELKFFQSNETPHNVTMIDDVDDDCNVSLSLTILIQLLVDSSNFQVNFSNISSQSGKIVTKFSETFPSNPVDIDEALQTLAERTLRTTFIGENFRCFVEGSVSQSSRESDADYKVESISDFYKKLYGKFRSSKKFQQLNGPRVRHRMKMKFLNQEIVLCYESDRFYSRNEESTGATNITVKLEYQTSHGAEIMSRDELLREWALLKFQPSTELLRFRIDAVSFVILSREVLRIEQIEEQLEKLHNTKPESLLKSVFNTILCINRLPANEYLMVANKSRQILIYIRNEDEKGEKMLCEEWQVSQNFTRKWTRIDENFLTFLHLNHQLPPCSYSQPNMNRVKVPPVVPLQAATPPKPKYNLRTPNKPPQAQLKKKKKVNKKKQKNKKV